MGSMLGKIGGVVAAAFAVGSMVEFGKGAIELASNLNEVQNVVDVTFGSMSNQINDFSKNAITQFGLSELSAKKFASTMGAMLKSSGITGQQLVNMSEGITGLAGDFASFYNLDPEAAFDKIRSGISGETEPLKQLGVNMSVANMEAYALSQGITTSYAKMNQASQSLLRYNYLLSVSKDAQGDFSRTTNSWANQTRLLSQQWDIMKTSLGQGLINMLTPLLTVLNSVIAKLQVATSYFNAFTEVIWGSAGAASGAILPAADGMDAMGDSAEGAGGKITKAAKAAKGALGSFDQLNVLGQKTGAGDESGGGAGLSGMPKLDKAKPGDGIDSSKMAQLKNAIEGIKKSASDAFGYLQNAFGPSLRKAFDTINPVLQAWKASLKDTFQQLSTLVIPLGKWFTDDLVPFWQQGIGVMGNVLAGLGDSALKVFNTIKNSALPVLDWFVYFGLPILTQFGSGALVVFQSLFDNCKLIFDKVWTEAVDPVMKILTKITIDQLNIMKATWDKYGAGIIDGIVGVFTSIGTLFIQLWTTTLGPIVKNMLTELSWFWDKHLKGVYEAAAELIGKLITGALQIWNGFIAPVIGFLVQDFGPAFSLAFSLAADVFGTFIAVIADSVKSIFTILSGIIDFITGVFTGDWRKAWLGVREVFDGIFGGIGAIVVGAVNLMIDAINVMIRGLDKIHMDPPEWAQTLGAKSFGIDIPEIQKLAKGGMVSAPTLAMIGDNKNAYSDPEVVSPLSGLQEKIYSSVQNAIGSSRGNSGQTGDIVLVIDGSELARVSIKAINNEQRRVGMTLLTV